MMQHGLETVVVVSMITVTAPTFSASFIARPLAQRSKEKALRIRTFTLFAC
jgi:hypothetical protein